MTSETGVTEVRSHDAPFMDSFGGGTSFFDAPTHAESATEAVHILRPVGMDARRRANASSWTALVRERIPDIRGWILFANPLSDDGTINFSMWPSDADIGNDPRLYVTKLGKILLGQAPGERVEGLCAEFAWALAALSGCSREEVANTANGLAATCVALPFRPMPMAGRSGSPGHTEHALTLLRSPAMTAAGRTRLLNAFFREGSEDVNSIQAFGALVSRWMGIREVLRLHYEAELASGDELHRARAAEALIATWPTDHVWPHSFVVSASRPRSAEDAGMEYVATLVFPRADRIDVLRGSSGR